MTELRLEKLLTYCREQIIAEAQEAEVLARYIFANPEASGAEFKSSSKICNHLSQRSFKIKADFLNLPTAFKASFDVGNGPKIAFIAEYDALPGFGSVGNGYAHACGHHWITGASVNAACALAKTLNKFNVPGEVLLLGCPDEELGGGKIAMLNAGAFDHIDLCLEAHLGPWTEARFVGKLREGLSIRFLGKQTHGSGSATRGANALHALISFLYKIEIKRNLSGNGVEFNWIISDGGQQANVVPAQAEIQLMVRADSASDLDLTIAWILEIAKEATGKELGLEIIPLGHRYLPIRSLPTLVSLAETALAEAGFQEIVKDIRPAIGSTDLGNVSQLIPTQYFIAAMGAPGDVYLHECKALDYMVTERAFSTMRSIAYAMCHTAIQLAINPNLLEDVWQEHNLIG